MTEYLAKQAAELDDVSVVFLCHAGAELVGFSLFYRWERCLYGRAVGFDYDRRGDSAAYPVLSFYEAVRYGIQNGLSDIDLGAGSDVPKILRGATPDPMWSVIVPSDRVPDGWQRLLASRNAEAWRAWSAKGGRLAGGHAAKWRLAEP